MPAVAIRADHTDGRDTIFPDAVDGGCKVVIIAGGDVLDDNFENLPYLVQVFWSDW
jgi:hypothetical protein